MSTVAYSNKAIQVKIQSWGKSKKCNICSVTIKEILNYLVFMFSEAVELSFETKQKQLK